MSENPTVYRRVHCDGNHISREGKKHDSGSVGVCFVAVTQNPLDEVELKALLRESKESLERARDWVGWTADCPQHSPGIAEILASFDSEIARIDAALGDAPCEHRWMTEVEEDTKNPYVTKKSGQWRLLKITAPNHTQSISVFCARCGITADKA